MTDPPAPRLHNSPVGNPSAKDAVAELQRLNFHLQLNVAVVADENTDCQKILRMFEAFRQDHAHLKLVSLFAPQPSDDCREKARSLKVELLEDMHKIFDRSSLDLILEMSGDIDRLTTLAMEKPATVGLLDQRAAAFFLEMIKAGGSSSSDRGSGIGLAASFASTLLESSPDAVIIIDSNYRIINCNANTEQLTNGLTRREVLGKHCHEAIFGSPHPCEGHERACPMAEARSTGRPARAVHEGWHEDGTQLINQVTTYPIVNNFGEITQFVDVIRDITHDVSIRLEASTRAIKDDLSRFVQEDRLATLGRLVASVCHEINNPIASIVTFNKLILSHITEGTLPPEGLKAFQRYLELSVREALRCGDIVKNLLTFARQKGLDSGPVDLVEMINTIFVLLNRQIEKNGVETRLDLPAPSFEAFGDFAQIQQCLMNLILNAIEAMPQGGNLTIVGQHRENQVVIAVQDTGTGISKEALPQIFEPFYSTKGEGKGVGLGLSMVYGIAREHGGKVTVVSEPGQGTTFEVFLPASSEGPENDKGESP